MENKDIQDRYAEQNTAKNGISGGVISGPIEEPARQRRKQNAAESVHRLHFLQENRIVFCESDFAHPERKSQGRGGIAKPDDS